MLTIPQQQSFFLENAEDNVDSLQFIEFSKDIETYSELPKEEAKDKLSSYIIC